MPGESVCGAARDAPGAGCWRCGAGRQRQWVLSTHGTLVEALKWLADGAHHASPLAVSQVIGRAKKNSGVGREVPITAKWGFVGRGQNATGQHLSSAFWHDNSSAAAKESEIRRQ